KRVDARSRSRAQLRESDFTDHLGVIVEESSDRLEPRYNALCIVRTIDGQNEIRVDQRRMQVRVALLARDFFPMVDIETEWCSYHFSCSCAVEGFVGKPNLRLCSARWCGIDLTLRFTYHRSITHGNRCARNVF